MTDRAGVYRRLLRRETHSSRSGAAVTAAAILALVLIAAIALCAWWLLDPVFREGASTWIAGVSLDTDAVLVACGGVAVLIALGLIVASLSPGRRSRHARSTDRIALIVDHGVLADAAAQSVACRCGLDRGQVSATVDRRVVKVRITPISGVAIDRELVARTAVAALADAHFDVTATVDISPRGVVA